MTSAAPHMVLIAPVGEFEPELLETLAGEIRRIFSVRTIIQPLIDDLEFARDPERDQYCSTPVLMLLSASAPGDAFKVVALTRVDLFIPILTYVYGEAQLGGRACIVSTHRLADHGGLSGNRNLLFGRVVKEVIHELGHTFRLRHCKEQTCIMHYCRSATDVDRKSHDLCRYCQVLLADEIKRSTPGL